MATIAELERLSALTKRLIPISQFERGALIRADDWNLLTGAVIELARAVLLDEEADATAGHEHPDEVDIGWLTPRLRELIGEGGLSDPVARRRMLTLERNNQKLQQQIDDLLLSIGKLRSNVDDVKVNDIGREGDITILRRRFEARTDARDEVLDLRDSLDNIRDNIGKALELGERITVDGEIADISDLSKRIAGLETLRESLSGADGNILSASSLDIRLAELQAKFVNQQQLDDSLEEIRVRPPQDLVDTLEADLHEFVDVEMSNRLDMQQAQYDERYVNSDLFSDRLNQRDETIRDETDASITELNSKIANNFVANDSFDSRLQELSSSLSERLGQELGSSLKNELDNSLESLKRDFNERYISSQQLNSRLAGFSAELQESITSNVRQDVSTTVKSALEEQGKELFVTQEAFNNEISAVNTRVENMRTLSAEDLAFALADMDGKFVTADALDTRLKTQQQQFDESTQEQIGAQVTTAVDTSLEDLQSKLDDLQSLEERINTRINNQLDSMRLEIGTVSRQTVETQLQDIRNDLRNMKGQVRTINLRMSRLNSPVVPITRGGVEQPSPSPSPLDADHAASSDFMEIEGIGPVFAKRLAESGITRYSELAALPTDELAAILLTSEANIERLQLQAKAARKAQE